MDYFDADRFFTREHAVESRSKDKHYENKNGEVVVSAPSTLSQETKELGNSLYKKGQFCKAIGMYTKALTLAAEGSESRGIAFANRSAVLFSVGLYKECILDVELALSNKYPKNMEYKLHRRLAICHKKLSKLKLAKEHYEKCIELVNECVPADKREATLASIKEDYEKDSQPSTKRVWIEYSAAPEVSHGSRKDMPGVSAAVALKDNKFLAKKKIKIGDVLCIENPLVSVLFEKKSGSSSWENEYFRCSHCYKLCFNLSPCDYCIDAIFCSEVCKKAAWKEYHKVECYIRAKFPVNIENNNEITCIKIVSTFGVKNCIQAMRDPKSAPKLLKEMLGLSVADFGSLDSFVLSKAKTAAVQIASCFELSDSDESALVEFIVKAMMIMHDHTDTVSQTLFHVETDTFADDQPYACGLYMFYTQLPHRCAPNCTKVVYGGKTFATIATKPIKPGEILTVSYQPDILKLGVAERKELLKKGFNYNCECEVCSTGMDPGAFFSDDPKFQSNNTLNELCQQVFELTSDYQLYDRGLGSLSNEKTFQKCAKLLHLLCEAGVPPLDVVFTGFQRVFERHLQYSAHKFNLDGKGELYLFPSDRNMHQELMSKMFQFEQFQIGETN